MNDLASAPPGASAPASAAGADACRVRFSVQPRPADPRRPARHDGFPGSGTLHVDRVGAILNLDGKAGGLFDAAPFRLAIPREQIFDAAQAGRRVCFDVHTPEGVTSVALLAPDAGSAARIAASLPMQVTSAFAPELRAHARDTDPARARPAAWATWGLIAVNLLLFVAMVASGVSPLAPDVPAMIRWGANFGPDTLDGDWWRLVTSPFAHPGAASLLVDLLVLARLGPLAERRYGSFRFLALYLFAGAIAGMTGVLVDPMQCAAGASGALLGGFGALAAYRLRRRRERPAAERASWRRLALGCAAYCLYLGLTHPLPDAAAQLGGLAAGLLLGFVLAPPADAAAREATAGVHATAAAGLAALLVLGLAYPLAHPGQDRQLELRFAREYMAMTGASAEIGSALVALQRTRLDTDAERRAVSNQVLTEIVPRWSNLHAVLSSVPLPDGSPYRAQRDTSLGMLDNARRMATTYAQMLVPAHGDTAAGLGGARSFAVEPRPGAGKPARTATQALALRQAGHGARSPVGGSAPDAVGIGGGIGSGVGIGNGRAASS